jgi:hypothetical protein
VPLSAFVRIKRCRPGLHQPLQPLSFRGTHRRTGPGLYFCPGTGRLGGAVAAETLPADMGYAWSNMSFQEKKASGSGWIVFAFSLLFVF